MFNAKELPIHRCQSTYCITEAHYWDGKIVTIVDPGDSIVGWCTLCQKYVCSRCTIKVKIPEDQWEMLPDGKYLQHTCRKYNKTLMTLQCKRCGTFLGKYDEYLICNPSPYT